MRRTILAISLFALIVGTSEAFGKLREMECREWIDREFRGRYHFVVDSDIETVKVEWVPHKEDNKKLFEPDAPWHKLWQNDTGRKVVIYAVNKNQWQSWYPIRFFSLDFEGVRLYEYTLGGIAE
jgi:hypothetical protein